MSDDTINPHALNPYNDLIDTIQSAINGFAADLCGAGPGPVDTLDQEFAELRRLCAELDEAKVFASSHALGHLPLAGALRELNAVALRAMDRADVAEAQASRLRVRAEAREAQLAHAQDRLRRLRQPAMDVRAIFYRLKGSGAAWDTRFWDGVGEAEARVTVAAGRAAEVDAAMLEIGLYPVGVPVPEGDGMVHGYSTDGTPPWEAELDDSTADTAEEPPEAPAPTPAAASPWRPPGWYRDTDGQVGRLSAVDLFRGTQTFRWGVGNAVLYAGPREERWLGPAELPRLEPVPAPGKEPAGSAR